MHRLKARGFFSGIDQMQPAASKLHLTRASSIQSSVTHEMPEYIVSRVAQNSGDHLVHRADTCTRLPDPDNRDSLGMHDSCRSAVIAARAKGYASANGCAWCSRECRLR